MPVTGVNVNRIVASARARHTQQVRGARQKIIIDSPLCWHLISRRADMVGVSLTHDCPVLGVWRIELADPHLHVRFLGNGFIKNRVKPKIESNQLLFHIFILCKISSSRHQLIVSGGRSPIAHWFT